MGKVEDDGLNIAVEYQVFDISKAKKFLMWEPKTDIDLGLDLTIEYFSNVI